jgi:hypothetical protein
MPRIDDLYLDCCIYLYRTNASAAAGEELGGSGCLVRLESEVHRDFHHYYAVTNRHVVTEGFPVVRLNNQGGKQTILPYTKSDWIYRDDLDLAACSIGLGSEKHDFAAINAAHFLTRDIVREQNV